MPCQWLKSPNLQDGIIFSELTGTIRPTQTAAFLSASDSMAFIRDSTTRFSQWFVKSLGLGPGRLQIIALEILSHLFNDRMIRSSAINSSAAQKRIQSAQCYGSSLPLLSTFKEFFPMFDEVGVSVRLAFLEVPIETTPILAPLPRELLNAGRLSALPAPTCGCSVLSARELEKPGCCLPLDSERPWLAAGL